MTTFGDVSGTYPNLSCSHFRYATGWDDAEEWLAQANEHPAVQNRQDKSGGWRCDRFLHFQLDALHQQTDHQRVDLFGTADFWIRIQSSGFAVDVESCRL